MSVAAWEESDYRVAIERLVTARERLDQARREVERAERDFDVACSVARQALAVDRQKDSE